jgi:alkylation response protein AidB-like acyl-CoA dehydrogenase
MESSMELDYSTWHEHDIFLSEEHRALRRTLRDFTEKEVAPHIRENDREQKFDANILKRMGELGVLGICLPVKYGGAGMDYLALAVACEELERMDTSLRVVMSVHVGLNSLALFQWGTEEQKQKYLVPQARGIKYAAYGLTEPNAGTDAAGIQTTAQRDGDDYILDGEKVWISLADVADHFLIIAYTDKSKKHHGMSAFIVEREFKGVSTGSYHGKLGVRAGNTGNVVLQGARVPKENMLGREGEGFKIAMSALDNGRYTVAAGATGLIEASLDASLKYCHARETFGVPIGEHQLVKQMLANMVQRLDAARLLVYRAGWMKNRGIRNTRQVAQAKWFATDASFASAADAIQIHGAYGYSDEYPVERFMRNAKGAMIYEGTSQLQQLIQADYALGLREDKPLRCELPAYDARVWGESG